MTRRALECLGVEVLGWRWSEGVSWDALEQLRADVWCVTVPPRGGQTAAESFHVELQNAAERAGVRRLIWTSSTAVYDPLQPGLLTESDAQHRASRHTGVDLLALENLHRSATSEMEFVALRFGGLFSEARHPVQALMKRLPVLEADGHVQWVHERDAADACILVCTHEGPLPGALNVVAPLVATRRELIQSSLPASSWPEWGQGGVERTVSSEALTALGMRWHVPCPKSWVLQQAGVTQTGCWEGPHGRLPWTRHSATGSSRQGVALMVHGYKGFRQWGNWKGLAERWAQEGWDVVRMDFSHNGHVPPFEDDCLDEEAWSANRYTMEVDEVAFALAQLAPEGVPLVVLGHSRGGGMAVLGARRFERSGGAMAGVAAWAPVSDVMMRFPFGTELDRWRQTNRLEVVNGRTGQTLVHPFAFYVDAIEHRAELDIQAATEGLTCPVLVVHGTADPAVSWMEGHDLSQWASQGTWAEVDGADHVFGMKHPWADARSFPPHLEQAWEATCSWLKVILPPSHR